MVAQVTAMQDKAQDITESTWSSGSSPVSVAGRSVVRVHPWMLTKFKHYEIRRNNQRPP